MSNEGQIRCHFIHTQKRQERTTVVEDFVRFYLLLPLNIETKMSFSPQQRLVFYIIVCKCNDASNVILLKPYEKPTKLKLLKLP